MFRLAFLVSLFFLAVPANASPSVALECPCGLKTLSDSVIEIEVALEEVAPNPEYEELRLEVWAYPYEMRADGFKLSEVDITNRQDLFDTESSTKVKAKLLDRYEWSLTVPNRLSILLYQENELVDKASIATDPVQVPLQTRANPGGWAIGAYPNFSRDYQTKTIRIDDLVLENFSSATLESEAIASLQLCKAKEGPRVFGSCIDKFSQSLSLSLSPGESSSYSIEGTFDLSLIPLSRVPERYTDLWLEVEFNEETIFQAIGSISDGGYPNYKLDTESPDLFLDLNDDGLLDHHEKIFGLTTQILDEPLDIFLLYGDAISEELGENLEARAMLGVSLAERMLQEAGVDARIRVLGMISVGDDVGLSNNEIFNRMRDADGPWADEMASAGENADFIFYLHNDVEEDTTDGLAPLNGSRQGGLLSAERIIERGKHLSVVDIDEGTRVSTLAHELGHLLGLGHSRREVYESLEENDRGATLGPGTFPWSVGHGLDSKFVTTMGNESKFNVSQRLELFSDPTKTCSGSFACGVDKSNPLLGADAATTLRFTYQQAKKISDGSAPFIYRKYWNRILQIPQGKFWMELDYGAFDAVDGVISQSLKIIETYDLDVLGRQSVVLEVQNSSGRSVRFEDFVEVFSDEDRDAISDAEELAVGTDPNDQSSCFDCYVFQDGVRVGLRGTLGADLLYPEYDTSLVGTSITSFGLGGDDFIYGLEEGDTLFGGAGSDVLRGYEGADELFGGSGEDSIFGGRGKDQLFGGSGDDYLYGEEGDDELFGGSGGDFLYGEEGDDELFGGSGGDFLYGEEGDDQIFSGGGDDLARGGDGNDFISGGSGQDFLYGGPGNDKLIIEKGGGLLKGEAGNDTLFVGTEFDEEESRYYVKGFELGDSLALSASIEAVRSGVFSSSQVEFQAVELSDNSIIYISEPFVGMPELSQFICSSDTGLADYSAFRGGSAACDLDGDQVVDSNDALPFDRFETVDTDLDGIGNNADLDDDNDGVEDASDVFPLDATETDDSDTDGVGDNSDAFPDDAAESVDSDSDSVGDNADNCPSLSNTDQLNTDGDTEGDACDSDDDNDGFSDDQEAIDGTNPKSRFSCKSGCFSFDVDENLEAQPLTDGLLVIRHLFGFSGDSLISGAVDTSAERGTSELISGYLTDADPELDIDGDGESKPLTDGLLLIRYLFGFTGDSLISGAIGTDATRNTAEAVESYIDERLPAD